MEGIFEPNSQFPFDKLVLTPPTLVSGGNYFIKFIVDGSPLYIQPPKCKTKSGITKTGKKPYTDLLFTNENQDYIAWMESLETHICKTIFENRAKWFETDMDLNDIENYFVSPLKIYKSGKFYLARANIPSRLGKISLSIYDENENLVDPDAIQDSTNLLTILEVQGIKCSARSFQLELEVKQMMVLKPSNLFEKCIIKSKTPNHEETLVKSEPVSEATVSEATVSEATVSEAEAEAVAVASVSLAEAEAEPTVSLAEANASLAEAEATVKENEESLEDDTPIRIETETDASGLDDILDNQKEEEIESDLESLAEFDLDIEAVPENETIQLKQRNDVYYEMYKQARRKARTAKKMALSSYLEAKRIKNAYMLDDILDSESDTDSDFDEIDSEA